MYSKFLNKNFGFQLIKSIIINLLIKLSNEYPMSLNCTSHKNTVSLLQLIKWSASIMLLLTPALHLHHKLYALSLPSFCTLDKHLLCATQPKMRQHSIIYWKKPFCSWSFKVIFGRLDIYWFCINLLKFCFM